MMYQVNVDGRAYSVELKRSAQDANVWMCTVNGKRLELDAIRVAQGVLSILIEGRNYEIKRDSTASGEHTVHGFSAGTFAPAFAKERMNFSPIGLFDEFSGGDSMHGREGKP